MSLFEYRTRHTLAHVKNDLWASNTTVQWSVSLQQLTRHWHRLIHGMIFRNPAHCYMGIILRALLSWKIYIHRALEKRARILVALKGSGIILKKGCDQVFPSNKYLLTLQVLQINLTHTALYDHNNNYRQDIQHSWLIASRLLIHNAALWISITEKQTENIDEVACCSWWVVKQSKCGG